MRPTRLLLLLAILLHCPSARAAVVINEIFYNAPDELNDIQWIELHNTAGQPVDLSGWTLNHGKLFQFPAGAAIAAGGYLVVAFDPALFNKTYNTTALGPLKKHLKRSGDELSLSNADKTDVDTITYSDQAPWPISADGYSSSLERICPTSPGNAVDNWTASPLPAGAAVPSGTPGQQNAAYSPALPPIINFVGVVREDLSPTDSLRVAVEARDPASIKEMTLLYRLTRVNFVGEEIAVHMTRTPNSPRFTAVLKPQAGGTLIRYRVRAVANSGAIRFVPAANDLRPTLSTYVHVRFDPAAIPLAMVVLGGPDREKAQGPEDQDRRGVRSARGQSALIFSDPRTGKVQIYDHINAVRRVNERGYIMHFHKDRPFLGMTAVSIMFEGNERALLAEALAYDVYRRAGVPAPQWEFVRLWIDEKFGGYNLAAERPNGAFLLHNKLDNNGNLYKYRWAGGDLIARHTKKTNTQTGHDDLIQIIDQLGKTTGEEQWKLIEANFNVEEMASYFAVSLALSNWDGFFNNHFLYHDLAPGGKWQMFPWDCDGTWGVGFGDQFNMPLTFGMNGDQRPENAGWWRPPGYFSGPLLANPRFRALYLARLRIILNTIYTREIYFPLIDNQALRLRQDAILRAQQRNEKPDSALGALAGTVDAFKRHVVQRREFLLRELSQTPAPAPANPRLNRPRPGGK
jgi:hypothetical protein